MKSPSKEFSSSCRLESDAAGQTAFSVEDRTVASISVVIPTYNEACQIASCIKALAQPGIVQVIVADGGSTDGTPDIAKGLGVRVVRAPLGRGIQINAGLKYARGDVALIVHGDCRLRRDGAKRILSAYTSTPTLIGGALGMTFSPASAPKQLLSMLNNLRARFFGIAFGDQGQFFKMAALSAIGGFPNQFLMEDVELSLRIKAVGQLAFLPKGIRVSGRRWDTRAFFPHVLKILWLFGRYLFERRAGRFDPSARRYYKHYYGRDAGGRHR